MHPEISVVIPGAKNDNQVFQNIQASEKENISFLMNNIKNIYEKYFKKDVHVCW